MRFLFDLLTDVIQLCDGALAQNMAEVVNVVGRAQLRDRLSVEQELQRHHNHGRADQFHKQPHSR
jgi:hypothetical protein